MTKPIIKDIDIQNKILTGVGVVPTIPVPSTITPDNDAWKATDILRGQLAYNQTDDLWFTRDASDTIQTAAKDPQTATNTANIATNTTNIATNTAAASLVNGKSILGLGVTTFSNTTGLLSVSSSTWLATKDGNIYLLEGGTGIGGGLITDFSVHPGAGNDMYLIYVDITVGSADPVELKKAVFNDVLFHTAPVGKQRMLLGQSHHVGSFFFRMDSLTESSQQADIDNSYFRNGYTLLNRGTTTFNSTTGKLTVSSTAWLMGKKGEAYTLEGGSGSSLITDFDVHPGSGAINIIYVDINRDTGAITPLQKAVFTDALFHTPPSAELERVTIGSSDFAGGVYKWSFNGLRESDLQRLIESNTSIIGVNTTNISTNTTNIATNVTNIELNKNGDSAVTGTDSDMSGANNWVVGLGGLTFDIDTTVADKMYLGFTTSNQAVKLAGAVTVSKVYNVSITAKLLTGAGMPLRFGNFTTGLDLGAIEFTPTANELVYTGQITAQSVDLFIGVIAAANNGSTFSIDVVLAEFVDPSLRTLNTRVGILENKFRGYSFFTEDFMQSLSQFDKPLTKVCTVGDSLLANEIGGAIGGGDDEGATMRPIYMDVNNIPRRIYDDIKFNPATHRRIDHADWTKSGTWTSFNDNTVWDPTHTGAAYHKSIASSGYIEIAVPDGQENFAFICQKRENLGVINITLNAGSIAAYGNTSVDLDRTPDSIVDFGNTYHTELYTGLPSGINTIRIAKEANVEEVRIWGGFYWSGNTLVVHNVAQGGHTMENLINNHLNALVVENDFDAILMEIPVMNEAGGGRTLAESLADLQNIVNNYFTGKDMCFMSCNPFGDNGAGTNYYTTYPDPDMEDYTDTYRPYLYQNSIPFVDVFHYFKLKIENRGGTLVGGEGGLYYTDDGQHPNTDGCLEWMNLIKFIFANKPIKY